MAADVAPGLGPVDDGVLYPERDRQPVKLIQGEADRGGAAGNVAGVIGKTFTGDGLLGDPERQAVKLFGLFFVANIY